jgi:glycosyltransferase involved in cell wall biosynthesis
MSHSDTKTSKKNTQDYPKVSVCTPTFNRRPFIETMFACFRNQTYPKSRIEWIIVDDGTDKIGDLVDQANIPQIKYFYLDKKMTLGEKRNYMHTKTTGSIIVYFDDDDYYPPTRISHAVERLTENPTALIAGTSEIFLYFKPWSIERNITTEHNVPGSAAADMNSGGQMVQFGPYPSAPGHATAGTFAFRRELLDQTRYNESASLAEEKDFLKDFTIPFVALDCTKTILVFSHNQNTFDKRLLLNSPWSSVMQKSDLKVSDFIRNDYEAPIREFFMEKVDTLLQAYHPGKIEHKPDVVKQLEQLFKQTTPTKQTQPDVADQIVHPEILMGDRALTAREIVELISHLNETNQALTTKLNQQNSDPLELKQRLITCYQKSIPSLNCDDTTDDELVDLITARNNAYCELTNTNERLSVELNSVRQTLDTIKQMVEQIVK